MIGMNDMCEQVQQLRVAGRTLRERLLSIDATAATDGEREDAYRVVRAAVEQLLDVCRSTGLVGPANRSLSAEMWAEASDVLCRGWMIERARHKPRGYAGDYELLGRMYRNTRCDDRLGSLIDRYFQEDAAPIAVRNRMRLMRDWIVEAVRERPAVKVAVVGSAFGLEVRDALLDLAPHERAQVAITLLDLDPAAISFARQQVADLLRPEQLVAESVNLFRLPRRPQLAAPLTGVDLLLCPGIFDYLDDVAAEEMLRLFWNVLAPGGRMTVMQLAPHNPSRALMEWIGNWHLIYRDEAEFRQVVTSAEIPAAASLFGAEPLGVDLYVTATKD
jgi:extracellular factor (EF) 3-hydroxypalmitic acid methyl ester biosynthesis protein